MKDRRLDTVEDTQVQNYLVNWYYAQDKSSNRIVDARAGRVCSGRHGHDALRSRWPGSRKRRCDSREAKTIGSKIPLQNGQTRYAPTPPRLLAYPSHSAESVSSVARPSGAVVRFILCKPSPSLVSSPESSNSLFTPSSGCEA